MFAVTNRLKFYREERTTKLQHFTQGALLTFLLYATFIFRVSYDPIIASNDDDACPKDNVLKSIRVIKRLWLIYIDNYDTSIMLNIWRIFRLSSNIQAVSFLQLQIRNEFFR